jgi:hypothetical protein
VQREKSGKIGTLPVFSVNEGEKSEETREETRDALHIFIED